MDQIKLAGATLISNARDDAARDIAVEGTDMEIRTLRDLELVLVGGGEDALPNW